MIEKLAQDIAKSAMEKTAVTVDYIINAMRNAIMDPRYNAHSLGRLEKFRRIMARVSKNPANLPRINEIASKLDHYPANEYPLRSLLHGKQFPEWMTTGADKFDNERAGTSARALYYSLSPASMGGTVENLKPKSFFGLYDPNKGWNESIRKRIADEQNVSSVLARDPLKDNWISGSPSVEHLSLQTGALADQGHKIRRQSAAAAKDLTHGLGRINSNLKKVEEAVDPHFIRKFFDRWEAA